MTTLDPTKLDPEKISLLTEVKEEYKLFSINMVDFYSGIHPPLLSKVATVLFYCILSNKMYRKPESQGYNESEAKRIFTNTLITPSDLVKRMNPVKFIEGENDVETDISNLLKKLQELEDNNIFYIWRFKQPFTYIFIMERDITSWKYYNSKGYLYPKSLKKITRLAKSMIDTMISLEKQKGRISTREEIESSFGELLNRLIDKMNPAVSVNLPRWQNDANIFTYTSSLLGELGKLGNFEGYAYDERFISSLPEHIKKKIFKTHKEAIMNIEELEKELIPQNENLVKVKMPRSTIKKTTTKQVVTDEAIAPEELIVKQCEPFKNSLDFLKYYRSFLRVYNSNVKLCPFHTELLCAGEILDMMILNGRNGDLRFLKFWIKFFYVNCLKGNNVFREDKTSLRAFKQTFDVYNAKYIG